MRSRFEGFFWPLKSKIGSRSERSREVKQQKPHLLRLGQYELGKRDSTSNREKPDLLRACDSIQAEHGADSQVVLVIVGDGVDQRAIDEELGKQCQSLPRGEYASKALSHSFTVIARDMVEAVSFSNLYAPEHLIINVEDAEKWESFVENAGSVFLGPWTPESVGDYASGTNHVLPTYGYARMYGGVSLDYFLKYMTVQSLTEEGLRTLGPYVATMAEVEGLDAHKRAVTLRLKDIEK